MQAPPVSLFLHPLFVKVCAAPLRLHPGCEQVHPGLTFHVFHVAAVYVSPSGAATPFSCGETESTPCQLQQALASCTDTQHFDAQSPAWALRVWLSAGVYDMSQSAFYVFGACVNCACVVFRGHVRHAHPPQLNHVHHIPADRTQCYPDLTRHCYACAVGWLCLCRQCPERCQFHHEWIVCDRRNRP